MSSGRARCAVVTISDTRDPRNDSKGNWLCNELVGMGHELVHRSVVSEDPGAVRTAVQTIVHGRKATVVLTIGSTGCSDRDCAPDALEPLFEKHLPGFGEHLRMLSFHKIGARAMFARATAGRIGGAFVFCIPGAEDAIQTAMTQLIGPQLQHMASMTRKKRHAPV